METFPRDSWLKWKGGYENNDAALGYWRPSIVTKNYVDSRGTEYNFAYLLISALVVMPDGTTKPCGQEVSQ